jgi:hypothetical protein
MAMIVPRRSTQLEAGALNREKRLFPCCGAVFAQKTKTSGGEPRRFCRLCASAVSTSRRSCFIWHGTRPLFRPLRQLCFPSGSGGHRTRTSETLRKNCAAVSTTVFASTRSEYARTATRQTAKIWIGSLPSLMERSSSIRILSLRPTLPIIHRVAFTQRLEAAISGLRGERPNRLKPLVGALFLCDSENATARRELSHLLDTDWMMVELFTRGNFPVDRVSWTAELTAKVEAKITDGRRHGNHDLYQISKVLRLPYLKRRFIEGMRQGEHLGFWYSRGVAEVWGKDDPEVRDVFLSMLDAEPEALSQAAEELPLMVDDRAACRRALLRGMRADVSRYDFLLKGCKNLGIRASDEEMVGAALTSKMRSLC